MTPKPPEGYRLAVKGETYNPGEDGKPALWYNPHIGKWKVWGRLYSIETVEGAEGLDPMWSIFAVPLTAMDELVALSQELGLYDMTDNPLVKGENDGSTLAS